MFKYVTICYNMLSCKGYQGISCLNLFSYYFQESLQSNSSLLRYVMFAYVTCVLSVVLLLFVCSNHIYACVCIYIYIYIYIERERELYTCIYIYIYIYIHHTHQCWNKTPMTTIELAKYCGLSFQCWNKTPTHNNRACNILRSFISALKQTTYARHESFQTIGCLLFQC